MHVLCHKFQSTLPREERHSWQRVCAVRNRFQSTLPREERRSDVSIFAIESYDFNPRSHERSDKAQNYLKRYYIISIHAPTRGATSMQKKNSRLGQFQSTLPREERLGRNARSLIFLISIHAPTRGATPLAVIFHCILLISIHAPTRGATIPSEPFPSVP